MDFRILGSLEAVGSAGAVDLGSPKQRALLAVLVLHLGEIVPVDGLIDALWPDGPPRTAAHSIQIYVSELRRVLTASGAADLIVTRQPGYVLRAPDDAVDARVFDRLVNEGLQALESGDRATGTDRLRSALALWRGPALSDFAYEEFAQPSIRRLTDRHLDVVEELAAADLTAGFVSSALSLAEAAVREDPLRERSREILMLALSRAGRHAEALRTYQRLRELLADELGLDPSPALQRLQERILLHDPSLVLVADEAPPSTGRVANPYKGLRPFTEQDAPDFFGRDALVDRLLEALRAGNRLVALVGPSGSGKSSVAAAGLLPRLREGAIAGSDRWHVQTVDPGAMGLDDILAAIGDDRRELPRGNRRILVLDQFEDLFTAVDDTVRRRILRALSARLDDASGTLTVLLTLRADFYDRPLLDPEFARLFIPGVMNVLPMTADELSAAVVGPAARAGVHVEPGLLAQLVSETAAQPGALPLLQFALTELFDQRDDETLTLAAYRALGALRGILSRRAEGLYDELDEPGREVAKQVFLRLVRPGPGTIDTRRRVALAELTDLDVDPVVLSTVLHAFGGRRLLSFDRDPVTGDATVEVAHEALLREWDRLAVWIDRHRAALRRHEIFAAAAEEWDAAGRGPDYLLAGTRLEEFEATIREGTLQLTGRERAFLEGSLERRGALRAEEAAQADAHRRLERRARSRLVALVVAVLALAIVGGYGVLGAVGGRRAPVGFVYNGPGVFTVMRLQEAGFDSAVSEYGLTPRKAAVGDGAAADRAIDALAGEGAGLVVAGTADADINAAAAQFAGTWFVVTGPSGTLPNVIHLDFADNEGSFLAGVAAARTSTTGTIGFIGGVDGPIIWPFEAGYEAGARAVDPSIRIFVDYLTPIDDLSGFSEPGLAEAAATRQYAAGADVIFGAAGNSGLGLLRAASATPEGGTWRWAIGVDTDQYLAVEDDPAILDFRSWQPHILTSMVKRLDVGVHDALAAYATGTLGRGDLSFGLANGGIGLATSGGFIDGIQPTIDTWRARIVSGLTAVPCIPVARQTQADALGVRPSGCGG